MCFFAFIVVFSLWFFPSLYRLWFGLVSKSIAAVAAAAAACCTRKYFRIHCLLLRLLPFLRWPLTNDSCPIFFFSAVVDGTIQTFSVLLLRTFTLILVLSISFQFGNKPFLSQASLSFRTHFWYLKSVHIHHPRLICCNCLFVKVVPWAESMSHWLLWPACIQFAVDTYLHKFRNCNK